MKVRYGKKPCAAPFAYRWGDMPLGVKKEMPSKVDAFLDIMKWELRVETSTELLVILGMHHASVSRSRLGKEVFEISHHWILKGSAISGVPYEDLCLALEETPLYPLHYNSRKARP